MIICELRTVIFETKHDCIGRGYVKFTPYDYMPDGDYFTVDVIVNGSYFIRRLSMNKADLMTQEDFYQACLKWLKQRCDNIKIEII